jgi:subtilisin family serine protease
LFEGSTAGGEVKPGKFTIYSNVLDEGANSHTYQGDLWPYAIMPDLRNEFSCDWEGCGADLDQNIWVFTVNDIRYVAFDPTPDGDASDALFIYQYTNDETEIDANGIDQENWITWKYNGEPWLIDQTPTPAPTPEPTPGPSPEPTPAPSPEPTPAPGSVPDSDTDPLVDYQWQIKNTGQNNFASNPGTPDVDLNLRQAWVDGYTGRDVIVAIIDEGLEILHEDLADNVLAGQSYNFLDNTNDPTLDPASDNSGDHGTSVAGIIGMKAYNNVGGVGIAYDASLVGFNYLEAQTSSNFSRSFGGSVTSDFADVFNGSFGTSYSSAETTYSFPSISTFRQNIYRNGVLSGKVYVRSAGNDFYDNGPCGGAVDRETQVLSCTGVEIDDTKNFEEVITVASLNADGIKSSYSTTGSTIWVSGFGGEYGINDDISNAASYYDRGPAIMTTDQSGCENGYAGENGNRRNRFNLPPTSLNPNEENSECNYTSSFNGTSAAAPSIAGVIALMMSANNELDYRGVKHILAGTSKIIDSDRRVTLRGVDLHSWVTNAAGYTFHNWYGFGKADADAAVAAAANFDQSSLGAQFYQERLAEFTTPVQIPNAEGRSASLNITSGAGSQGIVEFIRLKIKFSASQAIALNDIGITLTSPSGTTHSILQPFTNVSGEPTFYWAIGVAGFYGENVVGNWEVTVFDFSDDAISPGTWDGFELEVHYR